MLQQTQVKTVLPYFRTFLKRYPSMKALAAAPEADVLSSWSGLGYYRRARALHRVAGILVADHRGRVPADAETLLALPGFGDYTTAAVGSIAHGLPLAAVDGNVRRVLSRQFFMEEAPSSAIWKTLASQVLDSKRPGDWNQAMMELGATVCTPASPKCEACPVAKSCEGLGQDAIQRLPISAKRPATVRVNEVAVAAVRRGKVLVLCRAEGRSFAGMWDLPRSFVVDRSNPDVDPITPAQLLTAETGLNAEAFEAIGRSNSTFTHHHIQTELLVARELSSGRPRASSPQNSGSARLRWVHPNELTQLPTGTAQRCLFVILKRHLDKAQT